MQVEILGTAAGGGFPQWNCACRNCGRVREGTFPGKARTQLQIAVSSDGHSWLLLNASPDLSRQIEGSHFLHPKTGIRNSPIFGILLTSGELDQSLGLLLLRELEPLGIFATASVRRILRENNSMFSMLDRVSDQARWFDIAPGAEFEILSRVGERRGISCLPLSLGNCFPAYVTARRAAELEASEAVLGLILRSTSGKRLGYFPAVSRIDQPLLQLLDSLDVLLFDGTFWSDDELNKVGGGAQTARKMGHIPVSSPEGSLELLSEVRCPRKMFVHVNNTNPMLDVSGREYHHVYERGWEIAEDGWHLEL